MASLFPQIALSTNARNIGFARAINSVLGQCTEAYAAIMNPDTIVLDGCFKAILGYMEKNPDVGIVGPKILNRDGSVQGSARSFPTPFTGLFGRKTFLTRLFPNNRLTGENILTTRSDGKTPMEVDWVSGACLVARRKVDEVGLMDECFFLVLGGR